MDDAFTNFSEVAADAQNIGRTLPRSSSPRSATFAHLDTEDELVKYLKSSRDIAIFMHRIDSLLSNVGIKYFGHQCIDGAAGALDIFGTYPSAFVDDYVRNQFHLDDFLLLNARAARGPIPPLFQTELTRHLSASPFISQQMQANIDLAAMHDKHGIGETCGLYIHDETGKRHCLLRLSGRGQSAEGFRSIIKNNCDHLVALGRAIGQVGWSKKFKHQFHNMRANAHLRIPPRPLELLDYLRKDLTLNEAAETLSISISTANQHIAAAKKALGTTTTHGTLLAAMQGGFLDP